MKFGLDHLLKRLRRGSPAPGAREAAAYWDRWQAARDVAPNRYVDWGEHPTILALLQRDLFGASETTVFDFLKTHYPQFRQAEALSLCSGDGGFEKLLVTQEVFGKVTGIDISPQRVECANAQRDPHRERLFYTVGDVNAGDFGEARYDVVFAKAALHHVEKLEILFQGIRRCLRPGGYLVTIDFFGPTRFQWSDAQLDAVNRFLADEMPADLARRPDGSLHRSIARPTLQQMIDLDPSEAVRSGELDAQIEKNFVVERAFPIGGTLLNLIFDGAIVNNFDPHDAEHNGIIEKAYAYEKALRAAGQIGCDFKFLLAHPRQP
jgi:SAM-dependent methyltransferase